MKSRPKIGLLEIGGNKGRCPKTMVDSGLLKGERPKIDAGLALYE
jgi:hypothetical protein